jgi:hypothetical protein
MKEWRFLKLVFTLKVEHEQLRVVLLSIKAFTQAFCSLLLLETGAINP